jgi:hypothetical protein
MEVLRRASADGNLTGPGRDSDMARVLIGLMPGFVLQGLLLGKVDAQQYCDGFESLTAH